MKVHCLYDELVPIKELKKKFHPKNRNKHPEEQIERLAKILKYQGVRYPSKISKLSDLLTSGHGRILAAERNGWKKFPVNYQEYDNEEQEYADVQADNAIASWAELDLSGINTDIGELGPDFDIDNLGLKNFIIEPADKLIDLVNKGDENSEWVGMPEFDPKNKEPKLVLIFETEEQRNKYINDYNIVVTSKLAQTWTSRL